MGLSRRHITALVAKWIALNGDGAPGAEGPPGEGGTPANTVVAATSFGAASAVGTGTDYAREDHTHGTPADPVTAHVAAGDPHVQYQFESEKSARFNYGAALSVTGVTIETEFATEWGCQRQVSATNQMLLPGRPMLYSSFLDLLGGDGFAIRLGVAAVIGDSIGGHFELQEHETAD